MREKGNKNNHRSDCNYNMQESKKLFSYMIYFIVYLDISVLKQLVE